MDKYELVERYEALGDEHDFLAAKRLFEQELTERSGALDRRQYGYLLECHGQAGGGRRSMASHPEHADAHGWELTAVWPRQELQRLQKLLEDRQQPGR